MSKVHIDMTTGEVVEEVREALSRLTRQQIIERFGGHGVRPSTLSQMRKAEMVDYIVEVYGTEFPKPAESRQADHDWRADYVKVMDLIDGLVGDPQPHGAWVESGRVHVPYICTAWVGTHACRADATHEWRVPSGEWAGLAACPEHLDINLHSMTTAVDTRAHASSMKPLPIVEEFVSFLTEHWDGEWVTSPLGQHNITYGKDENGDEYAVVAMTLGTPNVDVYAEIEDGTYGELQGIRIYRKDLQ